MNYLRSNEIRLPNGEVIGVNDQQWQRVWDRASHSAPGANAEYTYFQRANSTTIRDTNITNVGRIPFKWLRVFNIGIVFAAAATIANAKLILDNAVFRLYKGATLLLEAPVYEFGAGAGLSGATTTTATDVVTHGLPTISAIMHLGDDFIDFLKEDEIKATIVYPSATTGITATNVDVILRGKGQRAVV